MAFLYSLLFCIFLATTQAADWAYTGDKGPAKWPELIPNACGGTKQSPINIVTAEVTEDTNLGAIKMSAPYYSIPSGTWTIENNGHSAQIATSTGDYIISGGGLGANYKLNQFHFHWGADNDRGSEHTLNGKKYPLELHFVHHNTKYANIGAAIDKSDGIAVLGFFFEKSNDDNGALQPIVDKLTSIVNDDDEVDIAPIKLLDLMGGKADDLKEFYRYAGSLTTPNCYESVTWTVFPKILKVSNAQMAKFRSLKFPDGKPLVNNFRPPMPLHGRTVYSSHSTGSSASTRSLSGAFILTTVAVAFYKIFS